MKTVTSSVLNNSINETLVYVFFAFLLMSLIVIVFFYFSRKKIIEKEIEKRNLEVNYQKELLNAVIVTQEEERKRIAQDLHDDISSKLNVVSLNTHLLNTPNLSKTEIEEITNNITKLTANALENSRRIAHDLLPPVLEKFGLHAGIEELVLEFNSTKNIEVVYKNDLHFDINSIDKQLHIFRILQELLNNSVRHGSAKNSSIYLYNTNGVNYCEYSDNGKGFNQKDFANQKGLGFKNIESRVNFLNGDIKINSDINKGIKVNFSFYL